MQAKANKKWFIGFFRYDDSKLWNRTNLRETKLDVETYLNSLDYVDKTSINVKEIELPE